ncbi:MAG: response regulator [Sulfurimonadaceae bacterium]|jgi:DNA-binding NtrC family response regulator|nr:response regulator [Sulfurimonadaceae bacterium]
MNTKKINIMIIDDEDQILTMLSKFLSRDENYSIKTFANPLSAIASIDKNTDIILLDIMMPQINGIDALPKILEKNPNVKILMMTAYSTLDKVLNAHRHGAHDYIMKPFSSLDALGKKVKEILHK